MTTPVSDCIIDQFQQSANKHGDRTAVIYLGTRYSYREIDDMSRRFAASLADLGIGPGRRVMIYLPNSIQWVIAWLAIQRIKAVCVPITPIYTPGDIRYIANDSNADAIVCADTNFGYVKQVLPDTHIQHVILAKMADFLPAWKRLFGYVFDIVPKGRIAIDANTHAMRRLVQGPAPHQGMPENPSSMESGDIAQIMYTGGTTKFPKGVPISHQFFPVSALEQIEITAPLFAPHENIILGNAPLFHVLGQTCGLATLLVGGALILQPRVNLDATLDAICRFKARTMIGVPAMYRMILEHDRLDQYPLESIDYWFCAGDVLPVEVGNRWYDYFGKKIYQGYVAQIKGGQIVTAGD